MAFYRKQIAALEQRNSDHAEITRTLITPLTPDSALINKSIRRYKKDGSVLEEGAAIYPACKSSGGWKLCGSMRKNRCTSAESIDGTPPRTQEQEFATLEFDSTLG
jgi:hypothetical protein